MPGPKALASLTYAVRVPVVLKYVGQLAITLAAFAAVPAMAGLVLGEAVVGLYFAAAAAVLCAAGALLARLPRPESIQANEALIITACVYLLAAAAFATPFMLAGVPAADALFESVSGVTTTGLSTLRSVEDLPRTLVFARAWMQFFGGLGIVVLSLALLVRHDFAARRLVEPASPAEHLATTTRTFALRVSGVYLALAAFGIALLLSLGIDLYDAVTYALAGVATGGFSPADDSIAGLGRPAQYGVLALGLLGAVSLPLYRRAVAGDWRGALGDRELLALVAMVALVTAVLWLLGTQSGTPLDRGEHFMLAISAQTTTGFTPADLQALDPASKLTLMVSMAIGGSVGSTAGGVKLLRLLMIFAVLGLMFRRLCLKPHAVAELHVAGRTVEAPEANGALALVLLFLAAAIASWLPFLAAGHAPLDALFEVVSALGTVGLTTGVASAELSPALKAVLAFDMLLGRVEFVAMLMLLYPSTWFGRRATLQ